MKNLIFRKNTISEFDFLKESNNSLTSGTAIEIDDLGSLIPLNSGYNLKISDMQAACGLAQLDKLEKFIQKRKQNFEYLKKNLIELEDILILPEKENNSDPSWFGFPISIKNNSKVKRHDLLLGLNEKKIGTRLLFSGNLTKQPAYIGKKFKISGSLKNTDFVMRNTFWVGLYPGLGEEELSFVVKSIKNILKN